MNDNTEQTYPSEKLGHKDNGQMSQILREMKKDKMHKLSREIYFLVQKGQCKE